MSWSQRVVRLHLALEYLVISWGGVKGFNRQNITNGMDVNLDVLRCLERIKVTHGWIETGCSAVLIGKITASVTLLN